VLGESLDLIEASASDRRIALGAVDATGALCCDEGGVSILPLPRTGDVGLSETVGCAKTASETGLVTGVGLEGEAAVKSSDTGLLVLTGTAWVDNELCLLFAKVEAGDVVEPSGMFNEER
jgi:hypothetical protein